MAWDEGLEELLRDDLEPFGRFSERRMFGGLAFLRDGNLLAGLLSRGIFYRIGKEAAATALARPGVHPFEMGRVKSMGGVVILDDEGAGDDALRRDLLAQALAFVSCLPPK